MTPTGREFEMNAQPNRQSELPPPSLISKPTPHSMATSQLGLFASYVSETRGIDFGNPGPKSYDRIHDWSTDFDWETGEGTMNDYLMDTWDFTGVIGERGEKAIQLIDKPPYVQFFPDSKINYAENALDFWIKNPDRDAIHFSQEGEESITWSGKKLCEEVSKWEQALRSSGIKKGDCVAVNMPYTPDFVAIKLAAANIGAPLVMGGTEMTLNAMIKRFKQAEPKLLIAPDGFQFRGKMRNHCLPENSGKQDVGPEKRLCIKNIQENLPSIEKTLVLPYKNGETTELDELSNAQNAKSFIDSFKPKELVFERHDFDHPLYYLFSSGSTGTPKGFIHTHGRMICRHKAEHQLNLNMGPPLKEVAERLQEHVDGFFDRYKSALENQGIITTEKDWIKFKNYFQSTYISWMMAPYHISALASGTSLTIFDGSFTFPDPAVQLRLAAKHAATHFITSAGQAKEAWIETALNVINEIDLSSVELFGYTGGAMDAAGFDHIHENIFPDTPIVSSSGGTDGCVVLVGGNPFCPVYSGRIVGSILGTKIENLDTEGNPVPSGEKGELTVTRPFMSMPVGFLNDPDGERYRKEYYTVKDNPRLFVWGDRMSIDEYGMVIYGRSGLTHNKHNLRAEPYDIYKELDGKLPNGLIRQRSSLNFFIGDENRIVLMIAQKNGSTEVNKELQDEIINIIKSEIGSHAIPDYIIAYDGLPQTSNGKDIEKLLNKLLEGEDVDPDFYQVKDHEGDILTADERISQIVSWARQERARALTAKNQPGAQPANG